MSIIIRFSIDCHNKNVFLVKDLVTQMLGEDRNERLTVHVFTQTAVQFLYRHRFGYNMVIFRASKFFTMEFCEGIIDK